MVISLKLSHDKRALPQVVTRYLDTSLYDLRSIHVMGSFPISVKY